MKNIILYYNVQVDISKGTATGKIIKKKLDKESMLNLISQEWNNTDKIIIKNE